MLLRLKMFEGEPLEVFQFLLGCYEEEGGMFLGLDDRLSIPFRMLPSTYYLMATGATWPLSIPFRMLHTVCDWSNTWPYYLFQFLLGCYRMARNG